MSWKIERLADACQLRPPKAEARQRLKPSDEVSFVPMNDLSETAMFFDPNETRALSDVEGSYTYFSDGDILLAKITPCFENGKLGVARNLKNGIGFGSSEYFVIRPSSRLLPEFLYYLFARKSFLREGANVMTGAVGHRRVPKDFIESYPVPVPPLDEQKRIVAILNEAFEGITKATINAEHNLANAQELFDSRLARLFVESGWKELNLSDAVGADCTLSYGIVQPGNEVDGGLPIVRPTDLGPRIIQLEGLKRIDPSLAESYRRTTLQSGDFLLCVRGATGAIGIAGDDLSGANVTRGIVPIRFNADRFDADFAFYMLKSRHVQQQIAKATYGTALMQINIRELRKLRVREPDLKTQRAIALELANLEEKATELAAHYSKRLRLNSDLKQSILHKAFSGELTSVKESKSKAKVGTLEDSTLPQYTADVLAFAYAKHRAAQRDRTFGRVKGQKVLHLVEAVTGVDLGRDPIKDAAGPNDSAHMRRAEDWAAQHDYFSFEPRGTGGYDFRPGRAFEKTLASAYARLAPHKDAIAKVVDLIVPMDSQEAEVLATVHAAWNNVIIDGVEPTRDAIIAEARENWAASKLTIPVAKFGKAIRFIRQNGIIPDGSAKAVRARQGSLI